MDIQTRRPADVPVRTACGSLLLLLTVTGQRAIPPKTAAMSAREAMSGVWASSWALVPTRDRALGAHSPYSAHCQAGGGGFLDREV